MPVHTELHWLASRLVGSLRGNRILGVFAHLTVPDLLLVVHVRILVVLDALNVYELLHIALWGL